MDNLDDELAREIELQNQEARARGQMVHHPRYTPVEVETPVYPVTRYDPYPPNRGVGIGAMALVVLLITGLFGGGGSFLFFKISEMYGQLLEQQVATNKELRQEIGELAKESRDGRAELREDRAKLIEALKSRNQAELDKVKAESSAREAQLKTQGRIELAEASRDALVSGLNTTIAILEGRLKEIRPVLGSCFLDKDCKAKETDIQKRISRAKLLLMKVRNAPKGDIVADPKIMERFKKEAEELTKSLP